MVVEVAWRGMYLLLHFLSKNNSRLELILLPLHCPSNPLALALRTSTHTRARIPPAPSPTTSNPHPHTLILTPPTSHPDIRT